MWVGVWVVFSPPEYTDDTQPHQLLLPPLIKYPQEQHSCFENEAMTRVTMLMWPCHPHYQWLMSYQHHYFRLSAPPSEAISCWHLDVWCVLCVAMCVPIKINQVCLLIWLLSTGASLGQGYQDNPTSSSHLLRLSPLSPVSPTNNWDPRLTSQSCD